MLLPLSSNAPGTLGYKIHVARRGMLARCYNPSSPAWPNYGGRGISVCTEWQESEEAFMQWALASGINMELSLDRIDNNGNYKPSNCRWATPTEQLSNQRRNRRISFNGVEKTLSQWANELGIEFAALWRRLERGLPLEQALTVGKLRPWKHGTRAGYECHKCRCEACTVNNTKRHQIQRAKRRSKIIDNS
jgi:hypothetical protein